MWRTSAMNPSEGLTLRGFLADGRTGAGLGGLRVELWHANGRGPRMIAASRSDNAGVFRFRLPVETPRKPDRPVDVEWRVLDRGALVLSEIRELPPESRREQIELTVPAFDTEADGFGGDADVPIPCEVVGQVKGPVQEGASVRAVLKTLRDRALVEEVVAEGAINSAGWYRMAYQRPRRSSDASDTSLSVRLHAPDGELVVESVPLLSPPQPARVDLRPRRAARGPSEYTLLERRLAEALERGPSALDGAESTVVQEVADWIDVDVERLAMFQEARALERETGLPAPGFYALGRSGIDPSFDLIDVPAAELRTTIVEAAADGIVDADALGDVDALVEQLARHALERSLRADAPRRFPGVLEVLEAADIPRDAIAHTLRKYQVRA